ncbi:MAG: hypothetical protein IIC67_02310 [Thaumarchaeota archaeon]|nr:hypothetical protein [Nitrososphaerota archaeon]
MKSRLLIIIGIILGTSVVITALLLVLTIGIPSQHAIETTELPKQLAGGFPPATKLTDNAVGIEISPDVKYNHLLSVDGYTKIHVFYDEERDHRDVILGKVPINADMTTNEILYSQNYIWITINPHNDPEINGDVYKNLPLNKGYKLISINDDVQYAPVKGMTQLVDFADENIAVAPLDLWFATDDLSYTIRGHITEAQSVEIANKILSIEN